MAKLLPAKDPDERFDYRWTVGLDEGDTLTAGTVAVTSGSAVIDDQDRDATGITFWVAGGIDGETVVIEVSGALTAGGRAPDETLLLPIVSTSSADANAMIAAFPAFAAVSGASIAYWLTRAARVVDDSWPDNDREHARMLLAAHYLTQAGLGTGAEAEAAAAGASGFKTMRSGALTLERFDGSGEGYASTSYGKQFAAILRAVKGGPRVSGTGFAVGCFGYRDRPIAW